ncbi:amidase [Streptomyces sp. NBC_01343]|uniref:hypothetical protein n=1 Tax=Streptomyces sp. NBC_01343 TaxID=2903832 RepID=UPI002E10756C|nr:amidase [Streptomyces sp. NBC_01343]
MPAAELTEIDQVRLRAAGAVPIGRATVAAPVRAGMRTDSEPFGGSVNPWDRDRTR